MDNSLYVQLATNGRIKQTCSRLTIPFAGMKSAARRLAVAKHLGWPDQRTLQRLVQTVEVCIYVSTLRLVDATAERDQESFWLVGGTMTPKEFQSKMQEFVKLGNELDAAAKKKYGPAAHLFHEADGWLYIMDGDADDRRDRQKHIKVRGETYVSWGAGVW